MKKEFGLVHLPKTAGTVIKAYFKKCCANKFINLRHDPVSNLTSIAYKDIYMFGFVRNPFDWYVSRYAYFIKKQTIERGPSRTNDAGMYNNEFKKKFKTLEEHLRYGAKTDLPRFWFSELYAYMFEINNKFILDYVGKVEDINNDISFLCKKFDIKPKQTFDNFCKKNLDKINKSVHTNYKDYYNDNMIELIYEKDKKIFEQYNYEF